MCDQLEGLRAEVEAGATERAALQKRLERLEGATFTRPAPEERGEFGERREKKSPSYSCPPHSRDGFAPASPPLAPRLARGRPPPIVIDVEDDEDDRVGRRDRRERREPRRTERDDDADDVIEDDATDAPPGHSPDEVIPDDVIEDAAEFEATLAGFRSRPAPLATNPFGGSPTRTTKTTNNPPEPSEPSESPTDDSRTTTRTQTRSPSRRRRRKEGEGSPRQSAVPAPLDPPRQEETVEEMLAAIAAEEEQRAARRGKKGNRKGNRKENVGRTSDRRALVDAYLERRKAFAAAPSFGDGFQSFQSERFDAGQGGAVGGRDRADRGGDGRAHPRVRQGDDDDGARGEAGRRLRRRFVRWGAIGMTTIPFMYESLRFVNSFAILARCLSYRPRPSQNSGSASNPAPLTASTSAGISVSPATALSALTPTRTIFVSRSTSTAATSGDAFRSASVTDSAQPSHIMPSTLSAISTVSSSPAARTVNPRGAPRPRREPCGPCGGSGADRREEGLVGWRGRRRWGSRAELGVEGGAHPAGLSVRMSAGDGRTAAIVGCADTARREL